VIVAALAFALVFGVLMGLAVTRALAASSGSLGMLDRAHARNLAELSVTLALANLADGHLNDQLRRGAALDEFLLLDRADLPIEIARFVLGGAQVSAEHPREVIVIEGRALVGQADHRVTVVARPELTVDDVWLTEYEVVDPAMVSLPRAACAWLRGDVRRSPSCLTRDLGPGILRGTIHSNDGLKFGPTMTVEGRVSTSYVVSEHDEPATPRLFADERSDPIPLPIVHRPMVSLPRDTAAVLAGVTVTCRFRGPTLLRFDGPRLRVKSPRSAPRDGEVVSQESSIGCMGIDRMDLVDVVTVTLPDRAVIEVVRDEVHDCVDHPLGLGRTEDAARDWWCNGGDAFVWGRYRGGRTVVAQDSIQIVWDVEPGDAAWSGPPGPEDLFGLVAGDSIVFRRPVARTGRRGPPFGSNVAFAGPGIAPFGSYPEDAPVESASTWDSPRVVAALVALRGSVTLQNPFTGLEAPGTLVITGSVAGRFKGVFSWEEVGTNGSVLQRMGSPVEFIHDERLRHVAPPATPITGGGRMRVVDRVDG
jgi:hypothetical protein